MSWFSRSRSKDSPTLATAEPAAEIHRSPGLAALFEAIRRKGPGLRILDLGPAVGSNVDFLSQLGCKLYIEDLFASRSAASSMIGEGEILGADFFEQLFTQPEETDLDVVLIWDLLNYLKRRELPLLGEQLRRRVKPGGLLFALASNQKQIPAQPIRFRIHSEDQLGYERRSTTERPGPRHTPADVQVSMKGFRVDRSYLLRHGMQEFLFVRE